MLKKLILSITLLPLLCFSQTEKLGENKWLQKQIFSDTVAINKHLEVTGTTSISNVVNSINMITPSADINFVNNGNTVFRLVTLTGGGGRIQLYDFFKSAGNETVNITSSENDAILLSDTNGTELFNVDRNLNEVQIPVNAVFGGNFTDANDQSLTNGQTLISNGTQMIGKDVETYVRDSVVDFIKVTTAPSSPGTAVASGGDMTLTYTVTGVSNGDAIQVTPEEGYGTSSVFLPYVAYYSGVNQVSVRLYNPFSTTITPADIQFYILVTKAK